MRRATGFGLVLLLMAAAPAYSQQGSARPASAPAQQTPATTAKPPAKTSSLHNWKSYCSEEAEYCISYPPGWDVVGDVLEGNGVVMAPPQPGKDKSQWNAITATVTALPEQPNGHERPSFDEILSAALADLPGKNVQTLQRTQMTLHDRDAELAKVQYEDKETGKPWVEEIVFIDDELAIYSIALRAVPEDVPALEETFRKIVATWRPSEVQPALPAKPAVPTPSAPPASKAPATKPAPPK